MLRVTMAISLLLKALIKLDFTGIGKTGYRNPEAISYDLGIPSVPISFCSSVFKLMKKVGYIEFHIAGNIILIGKINGCFRAKPWP